MSRKDQLSTVRTQIEASVREMDNIGRVGREEGSARSGRTRSPYCAGYFGASRPDLQDLQAERRQKLRDAEAGKVDTELREERARRTRRR